MVRIVLMLANIMLKCSVSFLKPISVSTKDLLMSSERETKRNPFIPETNGINSGHPAPPSGLICICNTSHVSYGITFLPGHFDGVSVAKRPFPFPCRVHFILDAAVDNPKLYLRAKGRKHADDWSCVGGGLKTEQQLHNEENFSASLFRDSQGDNGVNVYYNQEIPAGE